MKFAGETCGDRKREAVMQADKIKAAVAIAGILLPWATDEQIDILKTTSGLLPRCDTWTVLTDAALKDIICRR